MVSHEQIKEILKNWKLENEKLTYVSESVYYVGDNYIIKFSPNINDVENHISVSLAIESVGLWSAKRELAKINYRIHTDAIKTNLIHIPIRKET